MVHHQSIEAGNLPTELLAARVPILEVRDALARVESMTQEVFGSVPYEILEREDPEAGDSLYFTLRVAFQGGTADTLKRYDDWHDRLSAVPTSIRGMFRLSVDARK